MDHLNLTTGVLDSWDLLYPISDTYIERNKESVQVLNNISAGYYPVCCSFYKSYPLTYDRPLIQVTVCPKSSITIANAHKRRKRHKNRSPHDSGHTLNPKQVYIVIPGTKKDKAYVIDTTNAGIFKEVNDNQLLSECILKSYIKDMNKTRKKLSEKGKDEKPLQPIPECSPGCAYMNMTKKTKNVSSDRSGSAPPQSPTRSNYSMGKKVESTITSKITTLSTTAKQQQKQISKSPDRNSLKNEEMRTKSPTRTNEQKTRIHIYQSDKNQKDENVKSSPKFSISGKRSIESIIDSEKRRSPERYEKIGRQSGRHDRIRITGRLGLTEDDKCVLQCDATLNDKPISTTIQGADCAMLPTCYQACSEAFRFSTNQRDAKIQAKESPTRGRLYTHSTTGKESQATQVDFQMVYSPKQSGRVECRLGKVKQQCACVNTGENDTDVYDTKEDAGVALKKHHSPFIVISVYSKNESASDYSGEIKSKRAKSTEHKKDDKKGRSRSPSPSKNNKKIADKKSDSRINASTSKKTVRETARKVIKSKVSRTPSHSMLRSTSANTKNEKNIVKNKSPKAQKSPPQSRRSDSPQMKQEEDNLTEKMKKALIEDFTKNYAEHMSQGNAYVEIPLQTKHNVSNITIDIEGDSEYYNVKLAQDDGKLNTELTVRKPPRGSRAGGITMSTTGDPDTTSLENFLYMPEHETRKRSFSQTLMFDGTDMTMNNEEANTLKVKDSIEVSHRRETKASFNEYRERDDIPEVDTEILVRAKHFQGDDCSIPNPVARDKEIKKLLGIDKGVNKKTKPPQLSAFTGKSYQARSTSENFSNITILAKNTDMENVTKNYAANPLYEFVNNIFSISPIHQLPWNKNIQLIYQFSSRRPRSIVLTRRQYDKLKRTMYNSLIDKHNMYHDKFYCNDRRFHEQKIKIFKMNTDNTILHYDKVSQTNNIVTDQTCTTSDINTYIISRTNCGDAGSMCERNGSDQISSTDTFGNYSASPQQVINVNNYYMRNDLQTIFIAREHINPYRERIKEARVLKTASVKDIQYRKMKIKKQRVRFSSSDSAKYVSKAEIEDSRSIHTIFKCNQKSVTPNFGTSAYSLCNSSKNFYSKFKFFENATEDLKPKKQFLKRLIPCLAFKTSPPQTKNPRGLLSQNSSFDSYQISTSLGAIEMSSSLYDTTASFYSDHTVPGNSIKRGFLSSVRGLLTRKKY